MDWLWERHRKRSQKMFDLKSCSSHLRVQAACWLGWSLHAVSCWLGNKRVASVYLAHADITVLWLSKLHQRQKSQSDHQRVHCYSVWLKRVAPPQSVGSLVFMPGRASSWPFNDLKPTNKQTQWQPRKILLFQTMWSHYSFNSINITFYPRVTNF